MKFRITLYGPPRTKKNSAQFVRAMGRAVLVPSDAYRAWFRSVKQQRDRIQAGLQQLGVCLPIQTQISVAAQIYQDAARVSDAVGFYQAIGDALQAPRHKWRCSACKVTLKKGAVCAGRICINSNAHQERVPTRDGIGIWEDDSLIRDWDGSRLHVDRSEPRVELTITVLAVEQQSLFGQDAPAPAAVEEDEEEELQEVAF